jgi:hypothetical protein
MSCPLAIRGLMPLGCALAFIAAIAIPACTTVTGDDEATAAFGVTIAPLYMTIENRTGTALVDGKVEIIPAGRAVLFTTSFPRLEIGDKRDFMLNVFRGTDGTPFRRGVVRARQVRVIGKDLAGKVYERIVPFE